MRFKIILDGNKEFHTALNIGEYINRSYYHGEVLLSWGSVVIMGSFCYYGEFLLLWGVFLSSGGFVIMGIFVIMERFFYHGEVLL
jgi:hypothetical protein